MSLPAHLPAMRAAPDPSADPYDLRLAWPTFVPAGRPEGEATDTDPGSPSLPATEDESEPEPLTEEETKNPRIKALSQEAAKWRTKFREAEKALTELNGSKDRADSAEANSKTLVDQLREARMQSAFLIAATGKVADLEAGWKLADKNGVTITDEGQVEGLEAVVTALLEKHPYLAPKPAEQVDKDLADKFPALTASGRPNNGKKGDKDAVDYEKLAKRFPALRGRR